MNLFYQEPDPDRWIRYDHFPRRAIRRLLRGPRRPGGQERVFLNLCAGLRSLRIEFKINDFAFAKRNPSAPVGIIGKPHVLDVMEWRNPILFGASIMSHPLSALGLFERRPIKRVLVPGEWMRDMCAPYWGSKVQAWPVGIDTDLWSPAATQSRRTDVLLYNKIRWDHGHFEETLLAPVRASLRARGLTVHELKYGSYNEDDFHRELRKCRSLIFICEHETQGIAYQQALSCGVPVLAWDRGGFWQDPEFYPDKVKYGPVSSVPYWDDRCGRKFADLLEFTDVFSRFWEDCQIGTFAPRDFILENLTLEKAAQCYLTHWSETFGESGRS